MKPLFFTLPLAASAAMLSLGATPAAAVVPIAENGTTHTVIVQNGFETSAKSLQEYLKNLDQRSTDGDLQ